MKNLTRFSPSRVALLILGILAFISHVSGTARADNIGPSFDCTQASEPDERAICNSARLSELDSVAASGYKFLLKTNKRQQAKELGRKFLQTRRACGDDSTCISSVQIEAIKTYEDLGAPNSSSQDSATANLAHSFVIKGRCHMGGCGFTQVLSVKELRASDSGSFLEVVERGEYVEAPIVNDEPQWDRIRVPDFKGPTSRSWVFCSTETPSVVFKDNDTGTYYVDKISPGFPDSIYGANTSTHLTYWGICHNKLIDETTLNDESFNSEAVALGYHRLGEDKEGQFQFRTIQQVFQFLGL